GGMWRAVASLLMPAATRGLFVVARRAGVPALVARPLTVSGTVTLKR
ncbi:MAG: hypothetical protein QOK04_2655, partial [Solirubrobacteraceae bacterium]|nr:hypothetical protein [Solirubrobacteraceae bacterium]